MGGFSRLGARVVTWTVAFALAAPIALVGLRATSAGSSPSVVQDVSHSADATTITVTASATTPGNLLVLVLGPRANTNLGATVSSITDNAGNTWVLATQDLPPVQPQRQSGDIFYVDPATSKSMTSVTVTWGVSSTTNARFYEVSGIANSPLDEHYSADAYGTTSPRASTTDLAQANEWAVAMIAYGSADITISGITPGWTNDTTVHLHGKNNTSEQSGHQTTSATTPLTYAGTLSSGSTWSAIIATFRAA